MRLWVGFIVAVNTAIVGVVCSVAAGRVAVTEIVLAVTTAVGMPSGVALFCNEQAASKMIRISREKHLLRMISSNSSPFALDLVSLE